MTANGKAERAGGVDAALVSGNARAVWAILLGTICEDEGWTADNLRHSSVAAGGMRTVEPPWTLVRRAGTANLCYTAIL